MQVYARKVDNTPRNVIKLKRLCTATVYIMDNYILVWKRKGDRGYGRGC